MSPHARPDADPHEHLAHSRQGSACGNSAARTVWRSCFATIPDVMIAARLGSPLVVGVGDGEHFIASDASPLVGYTDKIVYLTDHRIGRGHGRLASRDASRPGPGPAQRRSAAGRYGATSTLNGYRALHAEGDLRAARIAAQRHARPLERRRRHGRVRRPESDAAAAAAASNRIILTACGTSWHAALVGEYLIEELARIPVEVEYASELRYRNPPVDHDTLVFAITQSGETADTLGGAPRDETQGASARWRSATSSAARIAQEADGGIYLHAGPEIGVASTKAYTSQCMVLAMLALYFGRLRHLSFDAGHADHRRSARACPSKIAAGTADQRPGRGESPTSTATANNFLYLGRQYNFPTRWKVH